MLTAVQLEEGVEAANFVEEKTGNMLKGDVKALVHGIVLHFSLGFRLMFLSIPFMFFVAGPVALIVSTFCLLLYLLHTDFGLLIYF